VPVPAFIARLLETEMAHRGADALVFESARGGGYLTLGQARYRFQKAAGAVHGCEIVRLHDYADLCVMPTWVRSSLWRRESRLMRSA
jgi:hypothetical protein